MLAKVLQLAVGACLCVFSVDIAAQATEELPDQITNAITGSDESFQSGLIAFGAFISGWAMFGIIAFSFRNTTAMKIDLWFNGILSLVMFSFGCVFIFFRNSESLPFGDSVMRGWFTDSMQNTPEGYEKYCPEQLPIVAESLEVISAYIKHIEVTFTEPLALLGIPSEDCQPAIIRADQQTCLDTSLKNCQDAIIQYINITNYDIGLVMIMTAFFLIFIVMASWKIHRDDKTARAKKIREEKEEKRTIRREREDERRHEEYKRDMERQRRIEEKRAAIQRQKQKKIAAQKQKKNTTSSKPGGRRTNHQDFEGAESAVSVVYDGEVLGRDSGDFRYV